MKFIIPLYDATIFFLFEENSDEYRHAEATEQKQNEILTRLFYQIAGGAAAEIKTPGGFYILSRNIRGTGATITYFTGNETEFLPISHEDTETPREFMRRIWEIIPNEKNGHFIIEAEKIA